MGKPMGVIKAGNVGQSTLVTPRAFRLNDLMDEARRILESAKAEADKTLRDAEARAREINQQSEQIQENARRKGDQRGYQEGFERGRAEGHEVGRKEAFDAAMREFQQKQASLVDSCRQLISTINDEREAWHTAARQDLIDLAMAIARRVTHHTGEVHREVVLANLEEAVRLVGARSDVTIAVNPQDAESARAFAKTLIDMREQWQKIRVVEEAEIAPGGCHVQWATGAIDATLETQLDRIEAELNRGCGKEEGM